MAQTGIQRAATTLARFPRVPRKVRSLGHLVGGRSTQIVRRAWNPGTPEPRNSEPGTRNPEPGILNSEAEQNLNTNRELSTRKSELPRSYNRGVNQEVFAALAEALSRGEEVALATITGSTGSTPQRVGAKMLVYSDGRTVGTIGGGC